MELELGLVQLINKVISSPYDSNTIVLLKRHVRQIDKLYSLFPDKISRMNELLIVYLYYLQKVKPYAKTHGHDEMLISKTTIFIHDLMKNRLKYFKKTTSVGADLDFSYRALINLLDSLLVFFLYPINYHGGTQIGDNWNDSSYPSNTGNSCYCDSVFVIMFLATYSFDKMTEIGMFDQRSVDENPKRWFTQLNDTKLLSDVIESRNSPTDWISKTINSNENNTCYLQILSNNPGGKEPALREFIEFQRNFASDLKSLVDLMRSKGSNPKKIIDAREKIRQKLVDCRMLEEISSTEDTSLFIRAIFELGGWTQSCLPILLTTHTFTLHFSSEPSYIFYTFSELYMDNSPIIPLAYPSLRIPEGNNTLTSLIVESMAQIRVLSDDKRNFSWNPSESLSDKLRAFSDKLPPYITQVLKKDIGLIFETVSVEKTVKETIIKLPEILILYINRYNSLTKEKNTSSLPISDNTGSELLQIPYFGETTRYRYLAFICFSHTHYYSYFRYKNGYNWYYYDDIGPVIKDVGKNINSFKKSHRQRIEENTYIVFLIKRL